MFIFSFLKKIVFLLLYLFSNTAHLKESFAIITFLNSPYKPLLQNFIKNLRHLNLLKSLHVYISDEKLEGILIVNNVSFTKLEKISITNKDASYGEKYYWYISKQKTRAFYEASIKFESFLFADTDVFFLNNPLSDLKDKCKFSICFQSNTPKGYRTINSGFFFVSNSSKTEEFFKISYDLSKEDTFKKLGDQDIINFIVEKYVRYRQKVFYDFLDLSNYPNGSDMALWSTNCTILKAKNPNIFILHNNWIKGLDNKIKRFKYINAWYY